MSETIHNIITETVNHDITDESVIHSVSTETIQHDITPAQGPPGPPGGGNAITGEIPTGTINGVNLNFALLVTPNTNTEKVFLNGIRQRPTVDYNMSSNIIVFISAPIPGDILQVDYNY